MVEGEINGKGNETEPMAIKKNRWTRKGREKEMMARLRDRKGKGREPTKRTWDKKAREGKRRKDR